MTTWQYLRLEYLLARRRHGWIKSLRLALKANRDADATIPF
jgi:hypothetical protein